jgi:hypothetical protein
LSIVPLTFVSLRMISSFESPLAEGVPKRAANLGEFQI